MDKYYKKKKVASHYLFEGTNYCRQSLHPYVCFDSTQLENKKEKEKEKHVMQFFFTFCVSFGSC